jgi:hypothetical protein
MRLITTYGLARATRACQEPARVYAEPIIIAAASGARRRADPPARSHPVIVCIIGYTVLLVPILAVLKFPQDLFMDSAEAYAWGQQFLGSYGRHPPLTGWIAGLWYRVFPAANWSSYALSHVMVGISLVSIYLMTARPGRPPCRLRRLHNDAVSIVSLEVRSLQQLSGAAGPNAASGSRLSHCVRKSAPLSGECCSVWSRRRLLRPFIPA